ncbi:hypothetical protein SAMN04487898_10378 [Pedobacter sp. ok626]|uniref:hypothetical protein n=1 Tax=Pedobacter sp. ok626 TaxID=1761882 RepID=UPI00088B2644|nr:hypothetical protein [Pedobacter sp. ok626]SDJ49342.1 hypothetical protein SAMN04487898_10378 [Pedobacter sp. ok626]
MKISRNDPFDLNLCIRGLGVQVTYMHSDVYEFVYHFTFKKSLRLYAKDFKNPWEQSIDDHDFFLKIEDPVVQSVLTAMEKLIDYKLEIALRFGIDEVADLSNEFIVAQAWRFKTYRLVYKQSKSYKKLIPYYDRTLAGIIATLSLYACTLTAQSYKIPRVLKAQLDLPDMDNFRLLNRDDNNVDLLINLIVDLKKSLDGFRALMITKSK